MIPLIQPFPAVYIDVAAANTNCYCENNPCDWIGPLKYLKVSDILKALGVLTHRKRKKGGPGHAIPIYTDIEMLVVTKNNGSGFLIPAIQPPSVHPGLVIPSHIIYTQCTQCLSPKDSLQEHVERVGFKK